MGWLTKIFKGSSHKISEGQYHSKYDDEKIWEGPTTSVDAWSDFENEDIDRAIALSLSEDDQKGKKVIEIESHSEEDEQLAKALQESLNMDSPPQYDHGSLFPPYPFFYPSGYRICAGCNAEIGHGRFLSCMGAVWHPECFCCQGCNRPISDYEVEIYSKSGEFEQNSKRLRSRRVYVFLKMPLERLLEEIPTNAAGLIEYRAHPFWLQKYCPSHEHDETPRCCSCERMESRDTRYLLLDDGRKLCLECLDSAIMDTHECQPLYLEIQEFYEGLNMKVEQQIPLLLVERQALNEAMEGEKHGHHHMPETRGLCLSEEQTVSTILRRPRIGAGHRIIDMFTEPYRLIRRCEVTAILILYSLPRLLTGSILAHEMMHAWLRLKGYPNLSPDVEEGICQVLAHMWLDSEIVAGSGSNVASTSTSSSSSSLSTPAPTSSKKGKRSDFEKKLGEFFKHQIESDTSAAYGDGFREGSKAVQKTGVAELNNSWIGHPLRNWNIYLPFAHFDSALFRVVYLNPSINSLDILGAEQERAKISRMHERMLRAGLLLGSHSPRFRDSINPMHTRARVSCLFSSIEQSRYCLQGLPLYLSRFFGSTTNPYNTLTLQSRNLATNPNVNNVSLYLQRARLIDSIRLSLRSNSPESLVPLLNDRALDSFVVTNALRSAPSPDSALSLIETLKTVRHFSHTQNTLYALAKILAKSHRTARLESLIDAMNSGKFRDVARVSFMDRMRWYAAAGDLDAARCVWDEWRALQKRPCTESYNIIMGLCAQLREDIEASKVFCKMIDEGALPNSRTYTIMIEHLVKTGKLNLAMEIFQIMPLMRMKRTLRQYSVLADAFSGTDQFDTVKTLLKDMHVDGILPGRAMRWSLQRMQETGFVEETMELVKEMLPDERIKVIKTSTDDSDNNEDDDGDEDIDCASSGTDLDTIRLKPWLDPAALASALHCWRSEEVSALEDAKFVWTTRLVCKMIRSFSSAETAWQFFCWVACQPGFSHDIYTVSRMLAKLARHGHVDLVDQLISKIKREGIRLSFSTIRLIIDFYGLSGNGDAALKVFRAVKTLCGPVSESSLLLLYSSLLRSLAKCKMDADALDILDEMILCGIIPDMQTFSGLMHHFARRKDIKLVQRLFGMVRQSGMEPDAYMFKVLIHAYCNCERAALALRVFEDMRTCSLMPDASTKQLLVKSLWKEGKLREAAAVEERSEEINDVLPLASPGHLFTVSSSDLTRVYKIYSSSFPTSS
ncbi:hypothetical protein RJ639_020798 [Escallonia herrerae]|uniref:LIM zinc-binding domain-containing protein n=1 Tax=Escallonia herrerae TaxID=1293975 RepID=A0AA88V2L4_9ASTE|nr:hypothetical protein RJ639_020798 [Escallonia herrerae]